MLKQYLKDIHKTAQRGDATEVSFYEPLKKLFEAYAESVNRKKVQVTTLPKATEAGNPDFRVWDGKQHIVGYIEAKAPTVEDLTKIEGTEQLKRYLHTFPNVILTNFFEFRLYRDGELIEKVQIGRTYVLHKLGKMPPLEKEDEFLKLLEKFFSFSFPKVYSAKTLAVELAKRTRFLRDEVVSFELGEEKSFVHGFYDAFKTYLISGLSPEDFADLYSQTVTYGLFAARTRSENGFNRKLAYYSIPHTIGILREVFRFISLEDLPPQMEWIIDDISEVLAVTDTRKILDQYFKEHRGSDPIVHFYETFLAEYDPATREKRGVYYTPEPVVSYIVRSLNIILKEYFGKSEGFASEGVTVLDPAGGTLTFMAEAAKLAADEFVSKYGDGKKKDFIRDHILKNFFAFELMMAPYAIGHMKMSFLLEELGYRLKDDERFKFYLTNTLEMEELEQTELPGMASLSEESHAAGRVKKEEPILVIMGNPPYSGHSFNKGPWISKIIRDYYKVDGKPLDEKNPKWLQDDYVKFIRFAQWKIDQVGEGILGFITNHSYLDNPTFRGMRQSLMQSFNEIYIFDLHGNALKKEVCPDGSKDENAFDIRQGVAIALFIKKRGAKGKCKVHHVDLWGIRKKKYEQLLINNINTVKWQKLAPKSEYYLFIPQDVRLLAQYNQYPKITGIFPVNSVGVVTSRDKFVIDSDKKALKRRLEMFRDDKVQDEIIRQTFNLKDKASWKLKDARANVRNDERWEDAITRILYRPFDVQWTFYHDAVIERSRKEVMHHMSQENLALITSRLTKGEQFKHAQVTTNIVEVICMSPKTSNNGFVFPLYLYPLGGEKGKKDKKKRPRFTFGRAMLFEPQEEYGGKRPNIAPEVMAGLSKAYRKTPTPEQIFHYIYGVLYSDIYRTKYAEFLRIDFPRIPFTKDYKLFKKMAGLGEKLVELHLLRAKDLDRPIAKFQGTGEDKVEKIRYDEKEQRVYINKTQYFEGVPKEVYEYQIGGYQVCNKWLKDRKDRRLSLDDTKHYSNIVTALQKTIELQKAIDEIYPDVERDVIEFPK